MHSVTSALTSSEKLFGLQNRLLLSIGGSPDADEVMKNFMQTVVQQLALKSIHLYTFNNNQDNSDRLSISLSIPEDTANFDNSPGIKKITRHFVNTDVNAYVSAELGESEVIAFAFGTSGVLLLENKQSGFPQSLKDALVPVIHKLAEYYQLCEQKKNLHNEVHAHRERQKKFELQSKRDPLTNLLNRREFRYSIFREISESQRHDYYGALLYIDLDNFKNVNDSLGHSIGDILLTHVAQRLVKQARQGDGVFRIGGDEFVYILSNIGTSETEAVNTSRLVANRVINALAKPVEIGEYSLHVTPSIGIALFPDRFDIANDGESVLRHADTAMYRAKKQGKNCYSYFNPDMYVEASKHLIIEDQLRKAINNNELKLVFQPIVNTDGESIGAETLVRWNSPVLGKISPEVFIHIAEESNLILDLSKWIMHEACRYAEKLYTSLPKNTSFSYLSINISPRQFLQKDFVHSIVSMLNKYNIPKDFIKLEFTETVLLDNLDSTIEKMKQLHKYNIDFLLDDFGTGYSSLSYLHKLPIRVLKIDKSFVDDIYAESNDTQVIVNAIMLIAEQLGIKCIIEGVETRQLVDYFKQKGAYGIQGFFFHKPMPGEELSELLCNGLTDYTGAKQNAG